MIIINVQKLLQTVLQKIKLYNMLIFPQTIFLNLVPKLSLMDFNLIKKFMDFILMVIMVLLTQEDFLIFNKNNSLLYILWFKQKSNLTMWFLEDIILQFLQKSLKMFAGFVRDGTNNNLNLPFLININKIKNLFTCTLTLNSLLLVLSTFKTNM